MLKVLAGYRGQTPETSCQFLLRNRAPGICAHRFQSGDHLGRGQYGRPVHLVNDPQEVVVLNVLFEGERSHAPVFRQAGCTLGDGPGPGQSSPPD